MTSDFRDQLQAIKNKTNHYDKPHFTFEQQVERLKTLGLTVNNEAHAKKKLSHINYYRLSAYFIHFQTTKDRFNDDAAFEKLIETYSFDSKLRGLLFNAIENIEVFARTQIAYWHSQKYGPFGYLDKANFHPDCTQAFYDEIQSAIKGEVGRSDEAFKEHFKQKYGSTDLPVWAMVEVTSFGTISKLYKALPSDEQKAVVKEIKVANALFQNWLHTLSVIRNACAHHSRVWDKQLRISFLVPNKHRYFRDLESKKQRFDNTRVFFALSVIKCIFDAIGEEADFKQALVQLLQEYPHIDIASMGFPANWEELELWSDA